MDTGKIKEASKKVAQTRDNVITKSMSFVDEKTKGKGTVAICMALLIVGALAMEQKLVAIVFAIIAAADIISVLVPETKKEEPKAVVVVESKPAEVTPSSEETKV